MFKATEVKMCVSRLMMPAVQHGNAFEHDVGTRLQSITLHCIEHIDVRLCILVCDNTDPATYT